MNDVSKLPNCPYCGSAAELANGWDVYRQEQYRSKLFWVCWPCDARVGCHGTTREALGTLANAQLRHARVRVHAILDPLWKHAKFRGVQRTAVYRELARKLAIPVEQCHVAMFDRDMCARAIPILESMREVLTDCQGDEF